MKVEQEAGVRHASFKNLPVLESLGYITITNFFKSPFGTTAISFHTQIQMQV